MENILEIKNLYKTFSGLSALEDINLELKAGQIYGLIGPNGAGKTTLFNCITGIYKPDKGSIKFQGEEITKLEPHKIAQRGILRTFQNIRLFGEMSVAENIIAGTHTKSKQRWYHSFFHTKFYKKDERKLWESTKELMEFFKLSAYALTPTKDLSYGNQRKVEMARALAAEPKLLILDEPAAGLNEQESLELGEIILEIKKLGLGIMMIEHDMDMLMKLSDYISVINFGKEISKGIPSFIQNDPRVIEAYLGTKDEDE